MIITILNMQQEFHVMNVAGASGREYKFTWNRKTGRYECDFKTQQELDDLFATCTPYSFCYFAPVIESSAPLPPVAAPTVERTQYDMLARPDLVTLARNCGLTVRASDDDLTIKRLLDSYFVGQGVKQAMEQVSTPKPPAPAPQDVPDLDLEAPAPVEQAPQRASGKPRKAVPA